MELNKSLIPSHNISTGTPFHLLTLLVLECFVLSHPLWPCLGVIFFYKMNIVVFLFVFDKYCSIID